MEKIKETYKYWLVISILIMIIFTMRSCKYIECQDSYNTITTYETKSVSTIDTIPFIDTIPYYVKVEVPVPIYDTVDNTNNYYTSFEDSLIKGEIFSKVDGTLVNQDFTYTPKFPKYIIKTDSIISTITITKEQEAKMKLFIGVNAGSNANNLNLGPQVLLLDKKDRAFTYNYNIIDKSHNVGYLIKLRKK